MARTDPASQPTSAIHFMHVQRARDASNIMLTVRSALCRISFVMPSSYSLDTLPVPKDAELELKEVPGHTVAAYSYFGGPPNEKRVADLAEKLKVKLEVRHHFLTLLRALQTTVAKSRRKRPPRSTREYPTTHHGDSLSNI